MADKLPWFPFYVLDFASDGKVEAMSTLEVGAYALLLCKAWHEELPGTIPNDDIVLARWARLDPQTWSACKCMVMSAFRITDDGTRFVQKRMAEEYQKLVDGKSAKSKRGKTAAKSRWGKGSRKSCKRIAQALHKHEPSIAKTMLTGCGCGCVSDSECVCNLSQKLEAETTTTFPPVLDNSEFRKVWAMFSAHREAMRKPLSDYGAGLILAKLAKLTSVEAIDCVNDSLANNWQGVFPPAKSKHKVSTDKVRSRTVYDPSTDLEHQ